jgi:molybdopterin converting factor subunit 1
MKEIRVVYYAALRELRGRSEDIIQTEANTVAELYSFLQMKFAFSLPADILRVAVNNQFQSFDSSINSKDTIVFIPPVAGG